MWTTENRPRYKRDSLRYPSDLTDAEWSLVAPLIPPAKRGGRKRDVDLREVVNGVMYGSSCSGMSSGPGRRVQTISVSSPLSRCLVSIWRIS
jgi:hypothetical protein